MPGYRALPARLSGPVANHVRQAELRQQDGDVAAAARMLELALELATRDAGEMPAWICGRLAAVYRSLDRHDQEVDLLERYCESGVTDEASARFRARLSKARAIADRARKTESGALQTVREVRSRSRGRRSVADSDDAALAIALP
jgi:hypothetical protein